jgi:hypothetical protein
MAESKDSSPSWLKGRGEGFKYLYDCDKDKGSNAGHHHVQLHVGLVLIVEAAPLLAPGHGGHSLACVQLVLKGLYHEMNICFEGL